MREPIIQAVVASSLACAVAAGEVAEGLVTTPAVTWRGRIVVPGGEARAGVRSNRVWSR